MWINVKDDSYKHDKVRPAVNRAFRELRKQGLVCRMAFSCCGGCASSELYPVVKKRKARGAVYFHRQSDASFRKGKDLYIAYGSLKGVDKATKAIGDQLVLALRDEGLVVEWDGDPGQCVVVKTAESYAARQKARA